MRIIKNMMSFSIAEFLSELYNDKNRENDIPVLDIYNYVREKTNGYDKDLMLIMSEDISSFMMCNISFKLSELVIDEMPDIPKEAIRPIRFIDFDEFYKYNIYDIEDFLFILAHPCRESGDINIIYDMRRKRFNYKKRVNGDDIDFVSDTDEFELNFDGLDFNLQNHGGSENILYLCYHFLDVVKKEKINIIENLDSENANKHNEINYLQLSFIDIFKKEYAKDEKIERFKNWLYDKGFVSEENNHISDATNFARIYFLLKNMGICNPNQPMKTAITAFFKEFGVDVVESIDRNAASLQTTRRTVTGIDARMISYIKSQDGMGNILSDATKSLTEIFKND